MIFPQTAKLRFTSSLITILLFLGIGVCLCEAQEALEQNSAAGELNLQGENIEYLVLIRKDGHKEIISRPTGTVKLPVGEYRLQQVRLRGGYICRSSRTPVSDWIIVAESKPAVLKVGGPLKHSVRVQRQGRILVLNYGLQGVGSEIYTGGDRSKPPTFTVYKCDKKIASGKFEFG
ncbi:MAG: hypothetical protein ACETWQ_14340 [Phycisphaerae bacterium]